MGKNLHDLGRTEEAIEVLKLGTEQRSLSAHLQLALIYHEQGDAALARETLLQAPTKDEIEHRENHLLIYVEQLLAAIR
mgnify:FL=1